MGAAPLPRRIGQHFGYRVLEALVGVTGGQEDAGKPTRFQVLEKAFPRRVD